MTKYFPTLYFHSHFFSLPKALCSEHFKAWFPVSSVWKWSFDGFWSKSFHILLLFLYAFPTYIKQWCPASHCSLLSHLLKRGGPVCPQKIFATSVKSSSLGYVHAKEHAERVSLPCQDTLSTFWTPLCSKPLDIGRQEWQLDELLPYLTITCMGLRDLTWITRPAAGYPFHEVWPVLTYLFRTLEIPSKALNPTVAREVHRCWVLLGLVCDVRQTLPSTGASFCLF